MVRTPPSNAGALGSIPGQGAKIPNASWPINQNIKQPKQYCNKLMKTFKNGPHQKKKKKKQRLKSKKTNSWSPKGRYKDKLGV